MRGLRERDRLWAVWATLLIASSCGGRSVDRIAAAGKNGVGGAEGSGGERSSFGVGMSAAESSDAAQSCRSNDLVVSYAPDAYSAYIEGDAHLFQFPLEVQAPPPAIQWTASDPFRVQMDPADVGRVTITTKSAGDVVITANAAGRCGQVTLHITAATEAEWQVGKARYNDMNPLPKIETDGGVPVNFTNLVLDPADKPPACTNCHDEYVPSLFFRANVLSSAEVAGFSDQQLIDMIAKGALPMDSFRDPVVPASVSEFFHTWSDITGQLAQGMVVYLRSRPPPAGIVD